jgi:hypothetical protein
MSGACGSSSTQGHTSQPAFPLEDISEPFADDADDLPEQRADDPLKQEVNEEISVTDRDAGRH